MSTDTAPHTASNSTGLRASAGTDEDRLEKLHVHPEMLSDVTVQGWRPGLASVADRSTGDGRSRGPESRLTAWNYVSRVLTEVTAHDGADFGAGGAPDTSLPPCSLAVVNGLVDFDATVEGAGGDALRGLEPEDDVLPRLRVECDSGATAGDETAFPWGEYWRAFRARLRRCVT